METYTPHQYADLVISNVEKEHFAKKDDFLGVGVYRETVTKIFEMAIKHSYTDGLTKGRSE